MTMTHQIQQTEALTTNETKITGGGGGGKKEYKKEKKEIKLQCAGRSK